MVADAGLNTDRFLHTEDPFEQAIYLHIARRVLERRDIRDNNRAVMTAMKVGERFLGA